MECDSMHLAAPGSTAQHEHPIGDLASRQLMKAQAAEFALLHAIQRQADFGSCKQH